MKLLTAVYCNGALVGATVIIFCVDFVKLRVSFPLELSGKKYMRSRADDQEIKCSCEKPFHLPRN